MYAKLTAFVLRWLRVPPEPSPPHGNPSSLRVFRAGRNLYRLKLARWTAAELLALAGIIFWVSIFIDLELELHRRRASGRPPAQNTIDSFAKEVQAFGRRNAEAAKRGPVDALKAWFSGVKFMIVQAALSLPPWAFPILWLVKLAGIAVYFAQLPVTFAVTRLDFEMRWYMVTDRSLRIRHGVWKISESTMSFANIQQVVVSQGPLQRWLGLADVKVQSAGGGGGGDSGDSAHSGHGEDLHHGLFQSVTNAAEIRDLILARLRHFREAGLGDPDDKAPVPATRSELREAAREFAAEARALRAALS